MKDGMSLIAYPTWLSLPSEVRIKLAKLFSISRTGDVIVRSAGIINGNIAGEVQQDGYTPKDLMALSVAAMQEKLSSTSTDFYALLEEVIDHLDALLDGTYQPNAKNHGKDQEANEGEPLEGTTGSTDEAPAKRRATKRDR